MGAHLATACSFLLTANEEAQRTCMFGIAQSVLQTVLDGLSPTRTLLLRYFRIGGDSLAMYGQAPGMAEPRVPEGRF